MEKPCESWPWALQLFELLKEEAEGRDEDFWGFRVLGYLEVHG